MSTCTSVVVFLPLILMKNAGDFSFWMLRIGIPVIVSLVASLFIALVFVPLAAQRLSRGKQHPELSPDVETALESYAWPGNIRELRNALERALILSRGETIELEHLPQEIREAPASQAPGASLDEHERQHILDVLRQANGNRTHAAATLGISRSTLKRKLAEMKKL